MNELEKLKAENEKLKDLLRQYKMNDIITHEISFRQHIINKLAKMEDAINELDEVD